MKQKITSCIAYLCAAISSSCLLLCLLKRFLGVYRSTQLTLITSASALLIASAIVFRWPRISHWLGLISGLGALYWFYGIEFGYPFPALNTWITFNLPDGTPDSSRDILFAKLKIIFAVTALAAAAISATRILPNNWMIRQRPVRDRLWPTLAICVFAAVFWYAFSVSPYRIPLIVDGVSAEITLLHIEKRGNQLHETGIGVFRDGHVYLFHNDRRLFKYRFPVRLGSAGLSPDNAIRQAAIALSEEFDNAADTEPPVCLHSGNAEGWYVRVDQYTKRQRILAFTTENGTAPPPKLVSVFHALESVVPETKPSRDGKDICFGFCYDPLAGLGIVFMNNRCYDRNGTHCR